jgi:hypothetical protein
MFSSLLVPEMVSNGTTQKIVQHGITRTVSCSGLVTDASVAPEEAAAIAD